MIYSEGVFAKKKSEALPKLKLGLGADRLPPSAIDVVFGKSRIDGLVAVVNLAAHGQSFLTKLIPQESLEMFLGQ